mgnify:CR=1
MAIGGECILALLTLADDDSDEWREKARVGSMLVMSAIYHLSHKPKG